DARSDLYAAGVVLYEMATGRRPFPATLATALADDILHKPPPPPGRLNPELSTRLEEIILKCLEKEPEHRYQSARELLVDFRRLGAPTAVPIAPSPQAPAWGRFGQRALPLAGIVVLTLAAVLFVWNVGGLREQLFGGPPRIESLAVLPLKNLMGAPEQDYFVEGMHEALITELSKVGALRVISRTSVMQYKDTDKPLPQIAEELNVEAVVEGSVLRSGDRVRITAQLVGAVPERHLWAENYDRELRDILALSSEVARAIANEIKITVTPEEETRLASARRVNPAAHEAYLKGRYFWNKATIEGVKKGLAYFEQAIEIDPGYALAYVGVADSYALGGGGFFGLRPEEGCARAKAAATKALELDATLAEPHTTLAYCLFFYDWDWLNAEREFKQAIELNPNYAKAHEWYGQYLTAMGRHEEAIAEAKRAQELDPLSLIINTSVGWTFYFARQYDQAIEQYRKTLEMDPNFVETRFGLRYAYLRKGMYDEAIAEWQREMKLLGRPEEKVAALGDTYAESGMRGVWQWRLENLKQAAKRRYVNPFLLAEIYTLLGEKDRAFEWLEKAYEEHAGFMYEFKEDPTFDPLRSDPRFQALLRRMRFPQD
ncbi:MAG: tetratricopeptide repeat protein, partial [Terriglobia bacterium]